MVIPHVNTTVNRDSPLAGAIAVVRIIRPEWIEKEIVVKSFTDGITNKLIGVKCAGEDDKSMILVRIHGNNTELIIDRKRELETIQSLEAAGCSAPLYCTFENGLCYGFVPGIPANLSQVIQPEFYRLIIKTMVKFHSVRTDSMSREPMLFTTMDSWLKLLPTNFDDAVKQQGYLELKKKLNIAHELSVLKEKLALLDAPLVFCHNDLLLGNIIYDATKGEVSFIDFEYGALNYRGFDIADHFCEYAGTDSVDYSLYPGREYQLLWLRCYLEENARFKGVTDVNVSDHDVEHLYVEVNQYALASHVFWGIWSIIQAANSEIDFDYMGYAHIRFDEYLRRRNSFLSLSAM